MPVCTCQTLLRICQCCKDMHSYFCVCPSNLFHVCVHAYVSYTSPISFQCSAFIENLSKVNKRKSTDKLTKLMRFDICVCALNVLRLAGTLSLWEQQVVVGWKNFSKLYDEKKRLFVSSPNLFQFGPTGIFHLEVSTCRHYDISQSFHIHLLLSIFLRLIISTYFSLFVSITVFIHIHILFAVVYPIQAQESLRVEDY